MKVNIIINCYNGENYLEETLKSVYAQNYTNWEIIFFDNASTDNTANIVKQYSEKIRYYRNEKLVPLGEARNMALKYVDAEFVAFLDSDDVWYPEKLRMQIESLSSNQAEFVYTNYYHFNQSTGDKRAAFSINQPTGNIFRKMIIDGYSICLSSVLLKAETINNLDKLFNSSYQIVEEFDLFMRLFSKVKVAYLHEPLVDYRIHDSMTTLMNFEKNSYEKQLVYEELMNANSQLVENDKQLKDAFINRIQRNRALYSFINKDYIAARQEFAIIRNFSKANKVRHCFYLLPSSILNLIAPFVINQYLKKI
jgi:glycosyltransferase involved in cell wall biosynthesis